MSGCYVYIMHSVGAGLVKIGLSDCPQARLTQIRTGNSDEIKLTTSIWFPFRKTAALIERASHKMLKSKRVRGEWFDVEPAMAFVIVIIVMKWYFQALGFSREIIKIAFSASGIDPEEAENLTLCSDELVTLQ